MKSLLILALLAGTAKVDITDRDAGPVNDTLYAKALVVKKDSTTAVLVTVDAVAIGEIGRIKNDFLGNVRAKLKADLGLAPESILINASHCHGVVRTDTEALTVQAVKDAMKALEPVKAGAGVGHEDRISENRRVTLKDGRQFDMRRAYAMPPDAEVASVGPIDPQIGLLRLDRMDGRTLALVYQFACHPIMGVPGNGNTADFPAFASKVIEENLEGAMAFFVQGCGGDINPVRYKEVFRPKDAEPLGNQLGLSVLRAYREIKTAETDVLKVGNQMLALPRGADLNSRIAAIEAERDRLVAGLRPTNISFKTFLPLWVQGKLDPEHPSHYSQAYKHDEALGRDGIAKMDAENKASVEAYLGNIQTMEQITRLNTNQALLKKHQAQNEAAGTPNLEVEVCGLRVGDFRLVTFPGELTVEIGLRLKKAAPSPFTFVSGYTNGYIYYVATAEQRLNTGYAQEDCDALVAAEWQRLFEERALQVMRDLQ